ncbi:hypothetical protein ACLB2K_072669 [Fragaria x ananassa]
MRLQGVSLPRTNQRQTFVCGMQLATGVMQGKDGCAPGPRQEEAWCTRCRGGARQGAACCRACRAAGRAEEAVHAERLGCSSSEGGFDNGLGGEGDEDGVEKRRKRRLSAHIIEDVEEEQKEQKQESASEEEVQDHKEGEGSPQEKESKKLGFQGKKVEKDQVSPIPNDWPFKEQELKALEARRARVIDKIEQKKRLRRGSWES